MRETRTTSVVRGASPPTLVIVSVFYRSFVSRRRLIAVYAQRGLRFSVGLPFHTAETGKLLLTVIS